MSARDIVMLIFSFLVVGIVLVVSQGLHKKGYPLLFTRKLVHVVIGLWVIPAMWGFEHAWVAAIPPIVAMIGNAVSHFTGMLSSIEMEHRKANYGTILYPAAFAIILLVFFPTHSRYWYAGMLGILIMAFGDTAAGVYGRAYGKSKYQVWDETRSVEGSMAMFIVSFFVSWLVLATVNMTGLSPSGNFILAIYVAGFVTAIEAVSLRGWDNFLVPVGSAFFTVLLVNALT